MISQRISLVTKTPTTRQSFYRAAAAQALFQLDKTVTAEALRQGEGSIGEPLPSGKAFLVTARQEVKPKNSANGF